VKNNPEFADTTFQVAPWVAHRTYAPVIGQERTVMSNDKDHEFLALEGPAARAWNLFSEGVATTPREIASVLEVPLVDVTYLFRDLENANLIISAKSILEEATRQADSRITSQPSSERYFDGNFTEPSPGGSNLEAEFEFQDWALAHGYLWSALWELTFRCNESCVHCFNPGASHSDGQRAYRKTEELSLQEATTLLDEMKSVGVFRLLLTGGEVALRKDFFHILSEVRKRGFSVTIFTNGTLFDDEQLKTLASFYPHRVELSLYSPYSDQHDNITRLKGSFQKTVSAAEKLRDLGVVVAIKMSVMAETVDTVAAFRAMCDEMSLESQVDYSMSPGVDGARDPILKLLPEALSLIRTAMTPGGPLFAGEKGNPRKSEWSERNDTAVCGAGRTTMSISPEGHIYPCNSLPIHSGSTRVDGLKAVWQRSRSGGAKGATTDVLSKWQDVKGVDYKVCGSYKRCAWCHKCPGLALLEGGDELGPSTTNCRNSAARMIAYDLIVEGRTPESISQSDLIPLQERYAENIPLWSPSVSIESRVSLEELRKSLKVRTRATALERSQRGISVGETP